MLKWETKIWQTLLLFQILYTDHTFLRSVSYANAAIDNRLWSTSQKGFEYIFKTSWKGAMKNSLSSWYVLKTSSTHLYKMSWRHFCKTSWKCLSKESWKCLEDVLEMSWRRLEDVLKTVLRDVLKTFLRRLGKRSWKRLQDVWPHEYIGLDQDVLRHLLKTRMKDVFKTYLSRPMFAGWAMSPSAVAAVKLKQNTYFQRSIVHEHFHIFIP